MHLQATSYSPLLRACGYEKSSEAGLLSKFNMFGKYASLDPSEFSVSFHLHRDAGTLRHNTEVTSNAEPGALISPIPSGRS